MAKQSPVLVLGEALVDDGVAGSPSTWVAVRPTSPSGWAGWTTM